MIYVLMISDKMGIDLESAVSAKIKKNETRYPTSKARGNAKKYTDL
jgi:hypothetical protein